MICVIAVLSPDASEKLEELRETAFPRRFKSPLYGHITVASYLPEDGEAFARDCAELIRGFRAFRVRYEKIEVLRETSVVAAVPESSPELKALHDKIAGKYGESLDRWTRGNEWRPHTTLVFDPEADPDADCLAMRRHFVPFETTVIRVEFSRVEENGYTILAAVIPAENAGTNGEEHSP